MLRTTPFHRVTYRRKLFLGGEREPALLATIMAAGLAFLGQNTPSFALAAVLWFVAIPALRAMAKSDPYMSQVYLRHIRYRGYYAARSRPYLGTGSAWKTAAPYALPALLLLAIAIRYWSL